MRIQTQQHTTNTLLVFGALQTYIKPATPVWKQLLRHRSGDSYEAMLMRCVVS
jgi:hypothetical protein